MNMPRHSFWTVPSNPWDHIYRQLGFSDKPKFFCLQNQFRSVCDVEFDEQFFAIPVDGFGAEEEGLGDLFGGVGLCEQIEDFALTVGDRRRFGRGGWSLCSDIRVGAGNAPPTSENDSAGDDRQQQYETLYGPRELSFLERKRFLYIVQVLRAEIW